MTPLKKGQKRAILTLFDPPKKGGQKKGVLHEGAQERVFWGVRKWKNRVPPQGKMAKNGLKWSFSKFPNEGAQENFEKWPFSLPPRFFQAGGHF